MDSTFQIVTFLDDQEPTYSSIFPTYATGNDAFNKAVDDYMASNLSGYVNFVHIYPDQGKTCHDVLMTVFFMP